MLLPLITYPYLIRVLGKEIYGLIVFAQAVVGYLVILVGFGFNISATKEISIHRDNKEKLNEIVSSVIDWSILAEQRICAEVCNVLNSLFTDSV